MILAISGLHISILGMGLFSLLKRMGLGNAGAGLLSLCVMLQYGMLTGRKRVCHEGGVYVCPEWEQGFWDGPMIF